MRRSQLANFTWRYKFIVFGGVIAREEAPGRQPLAQRSDLR